MFEVIRKIFELSYYVSGIVLCVGIFIAYSQMKVSKESAAQDAARCRKERAIDMADKYLRDTVDKCNKLFNLKKKLGVSFKVRKNISKFKFEINDCMWMNDDCNWDLVVTSMLICNDLELISSSFVSGIADEETGFSIIGRSFCSTVEDNYDVLSIAYGNKAYPPYKNVIELYGIWSPRIRVGELNAELEAVLKGSMAMNILPSLNAVGR